MTQRLRYSGFACLTRLPLPRVRATNRSKPMRYCNEPILTRSRQVCLFTPLTRRTGVTCNREPAKNVRFASLRRNAIQPTPPSHETSNECNSGPTQVLDATLCISKGRFRTERSIGVSRRHNPCPVHLRGGLFVFLHIIF
jgi:hypothetical protein